MQTEKLSFGILVLIESISKRKLNELNVKLTKSIQKFYHKFGYYPQYIHDINDYCLQSINIIKKHVLLGNYPTNKLYKITNFNQAHYHISKVFDDSIKRETNINNMLESDCNFN